MAFNLLSRKTGCLQMCQQRECISRDAPLAQAGSPAPAPAVVTAALSLQNPRGQGSQFPGPLLRSGAQAALSSCSKASETCFLPIPAPPAGSPHSREARVEEKMSHTHPPSPV